MNELMELLIDYFFGDKPASEAYDLQLKLERRGCSLGRQAQIWKDLEDVIENHAKELVKKRGKNEAT